MSDLIRPLSPIKKGALSIVSAVALVKARTESYLYSPQPTFTKSYPSRPDLKHLFFLPPNIDLNDKTRKYPLFIEIHGGGFFAGHPCMDDELCSILATKCSVIAVSMNYSKAPNHPYPTAPNDCIATVKAMLADSSLPIDTSKVMIGGMSAGANLALSTAQCDELQGVFRAMLIWYPIVDMTIDMQTRVDFRPKTTEPDFVQPHMSIMLSAYVTDEEQDLKEPALSPYYADVSKFPKRAFFVAAEMDILSYDTLIMAEKLAGGAEKVHDKTEGEVDIVKEWNAGQVKFCMALGQTHGFNIQRGLKGKAEEERARATGLLHDKIVEWMLEEVLM